MQPSILIGFAVGFGTLALTVLLESGGQVSAVLAFFNLPALLIILGGLTGILLIGFPIAQIREIGVALRKAFGGFSDIDQLEMSVHMLALAQKSRQEGILALESVLPEVADDWLRRSLQRVVDGLDRQMVQDILAVEMEEYTRKVRTGARILTSLGGFAPTLGIIGTVMGLVHMLASLQEADKIGGAIAVAFMATFWGITVANLVLLPLAERVRFRDNELLATRQAMVEGILSIQAGEPVRIIEEKLKLFMDPDLQREFTERQVASGGGRQENG